MNWKNRLTNYNFWISIISAVLLILQALKIEFDIAYINEIATAVLGLLVVIGIISDPTRYTVKDVSSKNKLVEEPKTEKIIIKDEALSTEQNNQLKHEENENSMPIFSEDEVNFNVIKNDNESSVGETSSECKEEFLMANAVDTLLKIVERFKVKAEEFEDLHYANKVEESVKTDEQENANKEEIVEIADENKNVIEKDFKEQDVVSSEQIFNNIVN